MAASTEDLVIVGCGGFGREVHDVVDDINADAEATGSGIRWNLLGYVDDAPVSPHADIVERRGSRVLGDTGWLLRRPSSARYVIGISAGAVRRSIDERLTAAGHRPATLVHPAATVARDVSLGEGTVICAGVRVESNTRMGRHAHVSLNSTVAHDCSLDDYVSINPLTAVSGAVTLHTEVLLGTHSTILQNLSVGARTTIGAAACVVSDVPADVVAKGVPARW